MGLKPHAKAPIPRFKSEAGDIFLRGRAGWGGRAWSSSKRARRAASSTAAFRWSRGAPAASESLSNRPGGWRKHGKGVWFSGGGASERADFPLGGGGGGMVLEFRERFSSGGFSFWALCPYCGCARPWNPPGAAGGPSRLGRLGDRPGASQVGAPGAQPAQPIAMALGGAHAPKD